MIFAFNRRKYDRKFNKYRCRRGSNLIAGKASFQFLINPPSSSTTHARIQAIQQGVGFSQNLALQADGGDVGIGMNNPKNNYMLMEQHIKMGILL